MWIDNKIHLNILGGGPAGLAIGFYAQKKNINFTLHEGTSKVGGNCKTYNSGSFRFDTGAHRFHDKYDDITEDIFEIVNGDLKRINSPSKIFFNNEYYKFPIEIPDIILKMKMNLLKPIIIENILSKKITNVTNFEDYAINKYGETLSKTFLINYTEKLWGCKPRDLAIDVAGDRLSNLSLFSSLIEMVSNKFTKKNHYDGIFYYPSKGYGSIFNCIYNIIGSENVILNSIITEITHNGKKFVAFKDKKNLYKVNHLISTLPINYFLDILKPSPPKEIIEISNSIKFRSLKLLVIFLNIPCVSSNASIYFPEINIPFTRLYEPKNRSELMAPPNQTCIVLEIPYDPVNPLKLSNQQLYKDCSNILIDKNIINLKNIIGYKVFNLKNAYPVLEKSFYNKQKILFDYIKSFSNIDLIGRSALFQYIHTHNIFKEAKTFINNI
ncbi:MAG: hypothetical protein CMG71_01940 [Candidatus Marinimicrobia bacterium]|nr:hypothetical protein [Candidatus Neomarinimicrobiota bacterium]|tara:strand:+ start:18250 stop:19569 length:1320 start_codon:yes stop_codon:yes gene_type:complete